MNCACEYSDGGIPVGLCGAHQLIVDQRVSDERKRCVAILRAEADRLEQIAASYTLGRRTTREQAGADALRTVETAIRKSSD